VEIASQMILFANVVDHGSFSATARSLGVSPSAVSKQIGHLEDRLGVRLLNRSTRRVSMTAEGQSFYERCAVIAAGVSEAEALAVSMGKRPQGALRIVSTVAFAKSQLMPLLPAFVARYPDLRMILEVTDRSVDLAISDYDLAIRFTEQVKDESVVQRKIAANTRVICAAPSYLAQHGTPRAPDELSRHNCLRVSTVEHWNDWRFTGAGGERVIRAAGNFEANSADTVYHATLAGLGIARLSTYLVGADLAAGRLVRLLPDHVQQNGAILAVYPDRRNLSPKVRVFIDFLVEQFTPVPPWEQAVDVA
jgi:DNA-binding transcriptional LysR family regulator